MKDKEPPAPFTLLPLLSDKWSQRFCLPFYLSQFVQLLLSNECIFLKVSLSRKSASRVLHKMQMADGIIAKNKTKELSSFYDCDLLNFILVLLKCIKIYMYGVPIRWGSLIHLRTTSWMCGFSFIQEDSIAAVGKKESSALGLSFIIEDVSLFLQEAFSILWIDLVYKR